MNMNYREMAMDEIDIVKEAEDVAQQAVAIITQCLDELRDAEIITAFRPEHLLLQSSDVLQRTRTFHGDSTDNKAQTIAIDSVRQSIVFDIFVPSFEALTYAYQVLDRIPEPPVIKGTKPKPPPGILSLRNYTDVACATECAVVLGILPHLEPNVLLALPERLRYSLPKSLAGRLPRRLLLQSKIVVDLHSRVAELDAVARAIGNLISLDRFQPMLLPRHVADLYAALLQANHESPTTTRGLPWLLQSTVPTLLQAKSFQTLLLFGTKGPLWLRQAVSVYLTNLAVQDLSAIVQVFVMPDINSSAAAIRLAKTLQVSRRKGKEEEFHYFSSLLQQCFCFLSHLENQEASKVQSVVHTAWAIIDIIPMECWRELLNFDATSSMVLSQFLNLFSSVPPLSDARRVIEWLWESIGDEPSIWCLWWRLAAHSEVLHVPSVDKVKQLLRLLTVTWLEHAKEETSRRHDRLVFHLLQALAPLPWDEANYLYIDQRSIRIEKRESTIADLSEMAQLVEKRTLVMIHTVLKSDDNDVRLLASHFFAMILKLYLSSEGPGKSFFRLVPLIALPLLCEQLSLEPLLISNDKNGIFEMMKCVFGCVVKHFEGEKEIGADSLFSLDEEQSIKELTWLGMGSSQCIKEPAIESSTETLLSVGSLLLGMLISILELGAQDRSKADEKVLQSFIEPLQTFARVTAESDDISSSTKVEIGEMSSHAVALLASRQVSEPQMNATAQTFVDQAARIEQDLKSSEPPIRARGVVTLRHLAGAVDSSTDRMEFSTLLNLTVSALADKESYVYLAAIHTLAAVADVEPPIVIPMMGKAVATGTLNDEGLSEEQRIKLAEALIAVIRRKAAIDEYFPLLMEYMLWGSPSNRTTATLSHAKTIQRQTHEYFTGPEDDETEEGKSFEERLIRLNTGGPLFKTEENDTLRASFLLIVAELWGSVRSGAYMGSVMNACRLSVSLDSGRLVRRAGALLARQMYSRLLERGGLDEARSMVAANEEGLHASLVRCYSLKDLKDLEIERLYDPATEARCREALDLREEAIELLKMGNLAWSVQKQEDANPIVHLLRESNATTKIPKYFVFKEID
jgi:hypothetical protein